MSNINEENLEVGEGTKKTRYLTFSLGKEIFGIEIKYVREIIGIQPITEIPEIPDYVKGIINLRGKIIPVMDVRIRFKKEFREYNDRTCIIVVDINNISMGLIVDSVAEVIAIPSTDIVEPPQTNIGFNNRYIKNIARAHNGIKLLIDCERLLSEDELENLNNSV